MENYESAEEGDADKDSDEDGDTSINNEVNKMKDYFKSKNIYKKFKHEKTTEIEEDNESASVEK